MRKHQLTFLSIILALSASVVAAQEGKSRAEVRAERDDAIRKGEVLDGTTNRPMHELYPGMYPKRNVPRSTTTRAQVRDELAEAIRLGTAPIDELGLTPRDKAPHRFPAPAAQPGKTRDEVKSELKEAIRKGELLDGTTGQPMHTLYPGMYHR